MKLDRVVPLAFTALVAACGGPSSPSSPNTPVVPALNSTTYAGHYRVTSCGSLCGYVGPSWPFTLTITKNGDARTAVIRTEPFGLEATLTGREQSPGTIVFTGSAPGVSSLVTGADFDVVIQESASGVAGSLSYLVRRVGQSNMSFTGEITSAAVTGAATPAQDFSGTWVTGGRAERLCTSDWGCVDPGLGVVLLRAGSGYVGLAQLRSLGAQPISIGVAGTVEGASLVLRGSVPKAPGQLLDVGQDLRLALRILPSGEIAGDYELVEYQSTYAATQRGAVMAGTRRPSMPSGSFTGTWRGWILHESCTGDCRSLHAGNFSVTLSQSGAAVNGMYATEFPMTGTASGASLILEGGDTNPGCVAKSGTVCSESLRLVVTGVDQWGMSGTGSHTWNGKYETYTKTGQLWNFTRRIE
jgi:hypothetical protein